MKIIFLLTGILFCYSINIPKTIAQTKDILTIKAPPKVEEEDSLPRIFIIAEKMPMFPDTNCMKLPSRSEQKACADKKFSDFCSRNISYFDPLVKRGERIISSIYFVVGVDGSLSDFQVAKGGNIAFNQESIRVIKLSAEENGPWIPAVQDGKLVPLRMLITCLTRR